jgi:hypothetical protein
VRTSLFDRLHHSCCAGTGPIHLKCTLIWSHHLLATSKRKDIVAWSTELLLFGCSKPGCDPSRFLPRFDHRGSRDCSPHFCSYPGVIVIEGSKENVDEFVWRIKVSRIYLSFICSVISRLTLFHDL